MPSWGNDMRVYMVIAKKDMMVQMIRSGFLVTPQAMNPLSGLIHTPITGRIQSANPSCGSIIYTRGVLESRIGGSTFWILPGVWEGARMAALYGIPPSAILRVF